MPIKVIKYGYKKVNTLHNFGEQMSNFFLNYLFIYFYSFSLFSKKEKKKKERKKKKKEKKEKKNHLDFGLPKLLKLS